MQLDIEKEYDRLYRYCYFHTKNQHIAEDITQETFLRYLKRNPEIHFGTNLAYLYTIARNLCIDMYRARKTEELTEETASTYSFENIEEKLSMKAAISTLATEQQEILLLRYAQELPVGEIAKILNISRFAFYRREKEVLRLLKEKIEGDNA